MPGNHGRFRQAEQVNGPGDILRCEGGTSRRSPGILGEKLLAIREKLQCIGVYHAGAGVVYYGVDHPDGAALVPGDTVGVARTLPDLDALLSSSRDPVLVTSQESLLRDSRPALLARIERDFVRQETFPAAIGGADLTVWLPRS